MDPFVPMMILAAVLFALVIIGEVWGQIVVAWNWLSAFVVGEIGIVGGIIHVIGKQLKKAFRHMRFAIPVRAKARVLGVRVSQLWKMIDAMVEAEGCAVTWALFQIQDPDLVRQSSRNSKA